MKQTKGTVKRDVNVTLNISDYLQTVNAEQRR